MRRAVGCGSEGDHPALRIAAFIARVRRRRHSRRTPSCWTSSNSASCSRSPWVRRACLPCLPLTSAALIIGDGEIADGVVKVSSFRFFIQVKTSARFVRLPAAQNTPSSALRWLPLFAHFFSPGHRGVSHCIRNNKRSFRQSSTFTLENICNNCNFSLIK